MTVSAPGRDGHVKVYDVRAVNTIKQISTVQTHIIVIFSAEIIKG